MDSPGTRPDRFFSATLYTGGGKREKAYANHTSFFLIITYANGRRTLLRRTQIFRRTYAATAVLPSRGGSTKDGSCRRQTAAIVEAAVDRPRRPARSDETPAGPQATGFTSMNVKTEYGTHTDEMLVRLFREGDGKAGNVLFARFRKYIYFFVNCSTDDEILEELEAELLAEFAELLRKYDEARGVPFRNALGKELYFCRLRFFKRYGKLAKHEIVTVEEKMPEEESGGDPFCGGEPCEEEILAHLHLTEKEREIADFCRAYPHLSQKEKAEALGMSRKTFYKHLARIRAAFESTRDA